MKSKRKAQKSENKFLSVVLPASIFTELEAVAKNADRSKSKYVELLIRGHLEGIKSTRVERQWAE